MKKLNGQLGYKCLVQYTALLLVAYIKVGKAYLYSTFLKLKLKAPANYTIPYLPLPCEHSPDGAT